MRGGRQYVAAHMSTDTPETSAWQTVAEQLLGLLRLLETPGRPANIMKFAEGFAALARAYLAAVSEEGRTSMRMEAVVKALDLKTGKTQLLTFLGKTDTP